MFDKPHHRRIWQILQKLNVGLLQQTQTCFAGGTAIALQLYEYRESVDIDFLCSSQEGYRQLRNIISHSNLGELLTQPVAYLREIRMDQYGIRTVLQVDGQPVKFEIVREARIDLLPVSPHPLLQVPVLSQVDLFAEKLLANSDRGLDRAVLSRDLIDLAMMIHYWGPIPLAAWAKAESAYGQSVRRDFDACRQLLGNSAYRSRCLRDMDMDSKWDTVIAGILQLVAE